MENILENKILELEQENNNLKNKYIQAIADLENYKKAAIKQRMDYIKYKNEDLAKELIKIEDDIFREISNLGLENISKGTKLIYEKFIHILEMNEIKMIPVEKYDKFNVQYMEAVSVVKTNDKNLDNTVNNVIEAGYILKDKVIKYAKVEINQL